MTVSNISAGNYWLSQLSQQGNTSHTTGAGGGHVGNLSQAHDNGLFTALTQALAQIGVNSGSTSSASGGSPSSSSASGQDPSQALAAFIQSLMAALHGQHAQSSGTQGGTDSDGDGSGALGVHGHGGHHGNLQADLQSLLRQLASSSGVSSSATSTSDTSGTGTSTSSDTALSSLDQSFQNLMTAFGDTSGTATLANFLQAFNNTLQGTALGGNVVNTRA